MLVTMAQWLSRTPRSQALTVRRAPGPGAARRSARQRATMIVACAAVIAATAARMTRPTVCAFASTYDPGPSRCAEAGNNAACMVTIRQ